MAGTKHSTAGQLSATDRASPMRVRLLAFGLVVGLGALLIGWIHRATWQQVRDLQNEFAALSSESFNLAMPLRASVRSLNDALLQFARTRDPAVRARFLQEARELQQWLAIHQGHLADLKKLNLLPEAELREQAETFQAAVEAFDRYLLDAGRLLDPEAPPIEPARFAAVYEQVQTSAGDTLRAGQALAAVQDRTFDRFLEQTRHTLAQHQRLLHLSLALILGLACAVALLVYRGMIAPLRMQLTESQAIIERQEKLASLGVLAAGVAHEIRNPLTAIKFRLFSLKKHLPPDFAYREDAEVIGIEINRLEHIVRDFLQFARPAEPQLTRLDARSLFTEVEELLKEPLEKMGITLRRDDPHPLWVHADPAQLKQVLLNLVQNAADSIGRNGTITLRARPDTVRLQGRARAVVVLAVADTGQGMPPEVERRLFDPFFSTKEGGTGLGLAISARIIEKHGGLIRHQTRLHQGSTFEIVLPRIEDHASATADR